MTNNQIDWLLTLGFLFVVMPLFGLAVFWLFKTGVILAVLEGIFNIFGIDYGLDLQRHLSTINLPN